MSELTTLSFDELNKLVGMNRSEPFDRYFAPMKISAEQKRKRIALAEKFEDEFLYILALMFNTYPNVDTDVVEDLKKRYINVLVELGIIATIADEIVEDTFARYELQAEKFAVDVVATTHDHKDDPYYYSKDRARFMAEDQSNVIYDTKEYDDAVDDESVRYKTWETVGDTHVRESHQEVEGVTIPVSEPFELHGGYAMFPHDSSMGISESEIIGCRCSVTYS